MFILTVGMTTPTQAVASEGKVVVWTYYLYSPFITGENQGLTHDFVALLNESANGLYTFHLEIMPRKRIDMHLEAGDSGIVVFVNPSWMKVSKNIDHLWTEPLFSDRNGILFNRSLHRDYDGPSSLYGLTMGGVFGRKYKGLDKAVAQGRIIRKDALNEELNVLKLSERRIDFMTAPESVLRFLVQQLGVEEKIRFSPTPLFEYERYILAANLSYDLRIFLNRFVANLPNNPKWQELKTKYALQK